MTRKRFIEDINYPEEVLNTNNWPSVNISNLNEKDLKTYNSRKLAVDLYLNGTPIRKIKSQTGIQRKEINRYVKNCLKNDQLGNIWGYRALIPYKRINKYTNKSIKKNKNGGPGSFNQLLITYPELRELIEIHLFKKNKKIPTEKVMSKKNIHKKFIKKCLELGLKSPIDYPFTSIDYGQRSLYRYINKLENLHFTEAARRSSEESANIASKTTLIDDNYPTKLLPFERVQFDAHKIDLLMSYKFEIPDGTTRVVPLDRIWILTIMDVSSRAIIGYHLCLNKEYNSTDVLITLKNSIEPYKKIELTIPGLKYPIDGGLPSEKIEETKWALWNEFYYDNAKANISKIVVEKLTKIINCHINTGPIYSPLKRSIIERFFKSLEENGFHRLPSTTGSHSKDPKRNHPDQQACKYEITIEEVEELTAVLIADYNSTRTEGAFFATPLESMQQKLEKNKYSLRHLNNSFSGHVDFLSLEVKRNIKGDLNKGRRPHINFENVKYTSELLLRSPALIGKKITLLINLDDLRFAKAYLNDGSEIGLLIAAGAWGRVKHTLKIRQEIFKLKNKKLIHFTMKDDPIHEYQIYLKNKAIEKKKYRNKLKILEKNINDSIEDKRLNVIEKNNIQSKLTESFPTNNSIPIIRQIENKPSFLNNHLKLTKKTITY
jgi:putative transposase